MNRKIISIIICFFYVFSFHMAYCSEPISIEDKIRIFYIYDRMFFFGQKENDTSNLSVEESRKDIIFSISEISNKYQDHVKEYLKIFQAFIAKYFKEFIDYHDCVSKQNITDAFFIRLDKTLIKQMQNELLPNLKNGIRCMLAVKELQFIEVSIKIDKDTYAATLPPDQGDNVFWTEYFFQFNSNTPKILDKQGAIKYKEWFYESNLKIRIVKQIRDEKGNYLGELYADYYKLDQYDKLFDEKGDPRKLANK
jgi:hypothetical protein